MTMPTGAADHADVLKAQQQNWDNFCQYHQGDWYGTSTRYSPQGEALESFRCVRCFHLSKDGTEINHQNHYTYADGKTETKTFGPYRKPLTSSLFLDNSFSWGTTTVKPELPSPFGFETGFRHEDRGMSATVLYDKSGLLQRITVYRERLGRFDNELFSLPDELSAHCWQGDLKRILPNLMVSAPELAIWKRPEDLSEVNQTLHFPDGISISCPQRVKAGKAMLLAVDWLLSPTICQRGIRYFDESEFTNFALETFKLVS